ncbi:hypothetical protein [Paraburkholderia gardini]|nr:hypothetical protein [Paraburkholderia gardini]CAG4913786.1 hypothetical protein R69919_04129 [Paraburkholderia gardini]
MFAHAYRCLVWYTNIGASRAASVATIVGLALSVAFVATLAH